jgi:hypothetical protein
MELTATQMQDFIDQNPPVQEQHQQTTSTPYNGQSQRLDVATYAAKYGVEIIKTKTHGSSTLFILKTCPFDETHSNGESALGQTAKGKLFFQCFHDSCQDKTWDDTRRVISGDDLLIDGSSDRTVKGSQNKGFADIANAFQEPDIWESPVSIDTPALPPITKDMMPKTLADMVFAVSANTETPPELATVLTLATCATACQKKYAIESMHGHTEQLSLWGLAALESGNRKSAVEKKVVAPLRNWEANSRETLEPIIKEATSKRENEIAVIKGLRNQLSKGNSEKRENIKSEIVALEKELTEIPKPPQLWEQDITPEHLGTVMDANNECLGLFSSEAGIFDIISGRYSKGVPNLDLFLQSHSGDPRKSKQRITTPS